jgi:hypothetical protein
VIPTNRQGGEVVASAPSMERTSMIGLLTFGGPRRRTSPLMQVYPATLYSLGLKLESGEEEARMRTAACDAILRM